MSKYSSNYDSDSTFSDADEEVDFDLNPTDLYLFISDSNWFETLQSLKQNPIQAKVWVVKTETGGKYDDDEIKCRFLPLHSSCARQPPYKVVSALLKAYPEGASRLDDNGMTPLHYACANQASARVIKVLIDYYPEGLFKRVECSGALPIHLAAQWGVSSIQVLEHLLEYNKSLASARDGDGLNTLELAVDAEYTSGREKVIQLLTEAITQDSIEISSTISSSSSTTTEQREVLGVKSNLMYESRDQSEYQISVNEDNEEFQMKFEAFKEEIIALRNQREFIEASAEKQIEYEWEAVNMALSDIDKKMGNVIKKKEKKGTKGNKDTTASESTQEHCNHTGNQYKDDLEKMKMENIKIENELSELKEKYNSYQSKMSSVEIVLGHLADTMAHVATGHSATLSKLQDMEKEIKKVSKSQALSKKKRSKKQKSKREHL